MAMSARADARRTRSGNGGGVDADSPPRGPAADRVARWTTERRGTPRSGRPPGPCRGGLVDAVGWMLDAGPRRRGRREGECGVSEIEGVRGRARGAGPRTPRGCVVGPRRAVGPRQGFASGETVARTSMVTPALS